MEFHGFPSTSVSKNSMKFHGKLRGIPWKIQWNSMGNYNEKIRQIFMKNFMEFHGIPWKIP
jgi:hypothetical protein